MQAKKFNIDFVKQFPAAVIFTLVVVIACSFILLKKGLNYGVDFTGGAEVQVKFNSTLSMENLRQAIKTEDFGSVSVQSVGESDQNEFLIKIAADEKNINQVTEKLENVLQTNFISLGFEIRKTDIVGPKAGAQLRISGFKAMFYALIGILIYIGLRFDFIFAPGAIVAIFHDVFLTLGLFSLLGLEFSLQIVGAILALIGYSVNDTVVIYDRVREKVQSSSGVALGNLINSAINETLTRTILTSSTTLAVSLAMYFLGGGIIHDFFLAISFGVIVGTYSTIYIASPITLFLEKFKAKNV